MGQILKINDVYYIEFYARGLLYSQIAGNNYQDAESLLAKVEAKIASGEALTIVRHIDLLIFYERFIGEGAIPGLANRKRYAAAIDHFNQFLSSQSPQITRLDQLTPSVMESYKAYLIKTQKPRVVNFTILLLRDILDYGIKLGFINDNPCLHLRLLPWSKTFSRKATARHDKVKELLSQRTGLGRIAQLMKISDVGRLLYFANLIPMSREDAYR